MADLDAVDDSKEYYIDLPQKSEVFFLKGSNALYWGMQNRLARIFNP
ncbi:MAG: 3-hydroxy-5-phosphonooxypentane-2,4-dione thiolase LsrF, partial [Dehalococcoidia bacterium]|nr:3-hydroxy-5-phosphonooxypentane-2,4-dione thiolase LsrF [Dehalococcoidia bacterium]